MANQFATSPFTLTTTMANSYRNAATVPLGQQTNVLKIRKLQWSGGTAAQTCVIQDGLGNNLAQLLAPSGADAVLDFGDGVLWRDFQVTTLATGTLFIYL